MSGGYSQQHEFALAARLKAAAARDLLADSHASPNVSTGERLLRLNLHEHFVANQFVLLLVIRKDSGIAERWAYAERGEYGETMVFAYGAGNLVEGMRITDCAVLNIRGVDDFRYGYGGELDDAGDGLRIVRVLNDHEFSSRVSGVSAEGVGQRHSVFAGTLKTLQDIPSGASGGREEGAGSGDARAAGAQGSQASMASMGAASMSDDEQTDDETD